MTREWRFARWSGTISIWLAALICAGIAALAWFGYRAADEWQRSSALLVDRRVDELADTLAVALARDMRAVQTTVIDGREWGPVSAPARYDLLDVIAGAFARYPYPEVFFAWQGGDSGTFYVRSERLPKWLASSGRGRQYPVEVLQDDAVSSVLLARINRDVARQDSHSIFETTIAGVTYQVIARAVSTGTGRDVSDAGFAVLVNLDWVHDNYFGAITTQVARIAGAGDGIVATIADERGAILPGLRAATVSNQVKQRDLAVAFFDPMLTALDPPPDLPKRVWTIRVGATTEPTLALAAQGARRTLVAIAAAAVALAIGLVITARAARAMANVSEMRSDFVSTVTHELKTPVQVIRSIGETMARGRVSTTERLHEYAQLLVQEGHRLSRLIDNLLAYSRVTDVAQLYAFEPHDPHDVVNEVLRGFQRVLSDAGFRVCVDVPETLPPMQADRTSIVLALDNLLDNAMRYSGSSRDVHILGSVRGAFVEIAVKDRGVGIAPDELDNVKRRFTRGRAAQGRGSGLGLAIANRIAADHGGSLRLDSDPGNGTTATLAIPVAAA